VLVAFVLAGVPGPDTARSAGGGERVPAVAIAASRVPAPSASPSAAIVSAATLGGSASSTGRTLATASRMRPTSAPTAAAIVSATTLGESASSTGRAVAVDAEGNTYVTGDTASADFPVRGARRLAPRGARVAAFVAKLDPSGRIVYATVLGGSRYSAGRGIAVDGAGRAYVTGATSSTDFPTTRGALQRSYGGGPFDAFVTVLDPTGRRLVYSTFLGDTHYDEANAIAVDGEGRAVIAGRTASPQFPRAGALRPPVDGGAFVAKLDRSGSHLVFSAVFGGDDRGNHGNTAFGVAVDAAGSSYATGVTNAASFPVAHALQGRLAGGGDAFVVKIDPAGRRVVYATYLGGGADDGGRAIAADAAGDAYVTGVTSSSDFPWRGPRASAGGAADAFVARLDPEGRALTYATRIGGSGDDDASAIAVDPSGDAYVAGRTGSAAFPLVGAVRRSGSAFISRIARDGAALAPSTRLGPATVAGLGLAIDRFGAIAVTGQATSATGGDAFVRVLAPDRRVLLRRRLIPRGAAARIGRVLARGGASLPFSWPATGDARISWYVARTLVARGRRHVGTGGAHAIAVHLTAAGRRLLRHRPPAVASTARGRVVRPGGHSIEAVTTFVLRR
jgi:Beta-propeller repeat